MQNPNANMDLTFLDLAGEWQLTGTNENGAPLACPATIPGDVHTALLAAGAIPDPYFGRNERDVQWVGRHEWTFTREFDAPAELLAHDKVSLRLDDCDTFATVFVNGIEIGRTGNRFRRYHLDAKAALRPGRNEIRLVFASAWLEGDRRAALSPKPYPMSCSEIAWFNNGAFIRKPACHRGWDWGLAQMTTGPCGAVGLVASDGGRIDYIFCDQAFSDDLARCSLRVNAVLETGETVSDTIDIDHPPLWWPAGQGPQDFVDVEIALEGKGLRIVGWSKGRSPRPDRKPQTANPGSVFYRVGLRKLEIDTAGGAMCFKVNNRPVFMKGADWIPCDAFDSRQTPARYLDLLRSARDANMNMLRLWGGGQFEKDSFYDLCDELGLLVWHDFMFSCALYPGSDEFLAEIREEAEHQVKRLRDHACIAIWCGDNECIGAARGWFGTVVRKEDRQAYIDECEKRFDVLGDVVARCDPARRFWPSSPSSGVADFAHDAWHDDGKGDMHLWTVWHENKPFSDYRNYRPRFCSEFGFQSFPSKEVAESFCPPGMAASGEPDFEWHQKNVGGNDRIRGSFERLFRKPEDPDSVLYLSQVQQAVGIKTAVETWRALRPHCMGTLYWQLDDLWPVSSWSSIEYGGKWKHLHYHARRFYAPVAIVANPSPDGKALVFTALNDTPAAVEANVRLRLVGFDGRRFSEEPIAARLPPGSATVLATRPLDAYGDEVERKGRFLAMEIADGRENAPCHRNEWFFAPFAESPLAAANVEAGISGPFRVELRTDAPAFFVWLDAPGVRGEFSDNSFTLLPGEARTVVFSPKDHATTPGRFREALGIVHLAAATAARPEEPREPPNRGSGTGAREA